MQEIILYFLLLLLMGVVVAVVMPLQELEEMGVLVVGVPVGVQRQT
jgi:hypothetical protein